MIAGRVGWGVEWGGGEAESFVSRRCCAAKGVHAREQCAARTNARPVTESDWPRAASWAGIRAYPPPPSTSPPPLREGAGLQRRKLSKFPPGPAGGGRRVGGAEDAGGRMCCYLLCLGPESVGPGVFPAGCLRRTAAFTGAVPCSHQARVERRGAPGCDTAVGVQ